MADKKTFKKVLKAAAITGAAVGGFSFLLSEVAFEFALTSRGMKRRLDTINLTPDEVEHYKKHPEEITDHRQWYETQPKELFELVSSHGEQLYADFIAAEKPTHKYAVIVHGWTSIPKNMATPIRHFSERGFNVLAPYMRAHGRSPEKVVGMGWPDRFDIIDWISYVICMDPEAEILLVGVSMGSATVMNVSGEQLPENVKCIIADCGFTSVYDIFANTLKDRAHLPEHPLMEAMRLVTKVQAGYDIKTAAPIDQVKKSVTPTLFVHGEQDTFIPVAMMYKLFDAASCEKELLPIPDADHAESWDVHPELYWPVADKFVDKYISADV